MRGAWKISEVKDLQAAEEQLHRDHQPGQGAVREGGVGAVSEEGKRLGVEKTVAFILDTQKNF